jgi:hypothetical protein
MAENKTKPTDASVEEYIASRALPYVGENSLSILSPKGGSKKRYCPSWESTRWAGLACTSSGWQTWTRRFLRHSLRTRYWK